MSGTRRDLTRTAVDTLREADVLAVNDLLEK